MSGVEQARAQNLEDQHSGEAPMQEAEPNAPADAGESDALKVPKDYLLTESRGPETGRWVGRLVWAPDGESTRLQLRLAERPTGIIEMDKGGRGAGSRSSTFTRDRQAAVDIAKEQLRILIRERLDDRQIDDEVEEAGGDLTLHQSKRKILQLEKENVDTEYLAQIERIFDIAIALKGAEWSVLLIDERFVDLYMERRTKTTIEFPDHLDRPNTALPPCSEYTAAKELHNLAAQIRKLSDMPRAPGEADRALRFCPFRSPLVVKRMPDPQALMGPPKRPLHAEHLVELLGEWTDPEGKVHPAPVDAVDSSGQLRLTVAIMYDQARRRESVTMPRRRNIALTEPEVRAMLERINGPIRPEWAHHFVNGLMEWEAEEDKQGFHRVYPISTFMKAELLLFEARDGWMKRDPDDWLFRSSSDPKLSLPWHTLYNTPEPRKAEAGQEYIDASGEKRKAEGGETCHFANGEVRYKRRGGRYQRAVALLRHRLRTEGRNPDAVFPVYKGEVAHGWRDGWAVRMNELGYGQTIKVDDKLEIDLDQNADYLGDWAVSGTVKHERYVSLHPLVLMGIVECHPAKEVAEEVARMRADETRRNMDALARLRNLHHVGAKRVAGSSSGERAGTLPVPTSPFPGCRRC